MSAVENVARKGAGKQAMKMVTLYLSDRQYQRFQMQAEKQGRNRLNDTAMAACYIQNGASRIITANGSDFAQFAGLEVVEY